MNSLKRIYFARDNDFWLHNLRSHQPSPVHKDTSIIIKGKSMNKELMFIISVAMPKEEADAFARSLTINDTLYIVKTKENPKARLKSCREKYSVVRPLRTGEQAKPSKAKYFQHSQLIFINRKAVA